MTIEEAAALFSTAHIDGRFWADLGCGDGVFTRALATRLAPGSTIHAIDRDRSALKQLPPEYQGVTVVPHAGDFTTAPLPFPQLDGVLMANSLHYVQRPAAFV